MTKIRPSIFAFGLALAAFSPSVLSAQEAASPDTIATELVGEQLEGAFFAKPDGDGPFPAIILLGGSEGGDRGARSLAKQFLDQGYAILGMR